VGLDRGAVLELHPHAMRVLLDADAAVAEVDAPGRHRLGEQRMQLAAREDHVRRAELLFDRRTERRARQRAAVLPAALVEVGRAERDAGAVLAEAEPDE